MFANIIKLIKNRFLILLGFLIFSTFIYYRFIRERLPRDIPFNLSTLGFFILIYIISIYIYIVFTLVRPPKEANESIEIIINWLYTPLTDFDTYFKNISFIKSYYYRVIIWLAYKLEFLFKHNYFDYIFYIFPRAVLITAFLIDIFCFGQLYYIYKVLLIGVLLVLRRYILYAFKQSKLDLITQLLIDADSICLPYIPGIQPSDYPKDQLDEEDEDDDGFGINTSMQLDLEIFITFWTRFIVYPNFMSYYPHPLSRIYPDHFGYAGFEDDASVRIRERLLFNKKYPYLPNVTDTFFNKYRKLPGYYGPYGASLIQKITDTIQVSVILEYKSINDNDKNLKYSKIIVFSFYAFCWLYILFVSFHTLNLYDLLNAFIAIKYPDNPFN